MLNAVCRTVKFTCVKHNEFYQASRSRAGLSGDSTMFYFEQSKLINQVAP